MYRNQHLLPARPTISNVNHARPDFRRSVLRESRLDQTRKVSSTFEYQLMMSKTFHILYMPFTPQACISTTTSGVADLRLLVIPSKGNSQCNKGKTGGLQDYRSGLEYHWSGLHRLGVQVTCPHSRPTINLKKNVPGTQSLASQY